MPTLNDFRLTRLAHLFKRASQDYIVPILCNWLLTAKFLQSSYLKKIGFALPKRGGANCQIVNGRLSAPKSVLEATDATAVRLAFVVPAHLAAVVVQAPYPR